MTEVSELAEAVYARVRKQHADCFRIHCALRSIWVEDVQEILDAAAAEAGDRVAKLETAVDAARVYRNGRSTRTLRALDDALDAVAKS